MGNTFIGKLVAPLDIVQTSYASPFEVPLVTLEATQTTLQPLSGKVCVIVNSASAHPQAKTHLQALSALRKDFPQVQVLLFPSDDFGREPGNFKQVRENYKKLTDLPVFGKVFLNGQLQSPLFKLLKRESELYDPRAGGSRPILADFNCFLIKGQKVKHYRPSGDLAALHADLKTLMQCE